jgi:formylglycine-generating enzyme required for sulfatase activity
LQSRTGARLAVGWWVLGAAHRRVGACAGARCLAGLGDLICAAPHAAESQQQGQQRWKTAHIHRLDLYHAQAVSLFLLTLLLAAAPQDVVVIPAGTFARGSTRAPDEQPVRTITLSAFRIDRHEVSVAEFQAYCTHLASRRSHDQKQGAQVPPTPSCEGGLSRAGRDGSHPVVAVTWREARGFCGWRGGTLPTEAQWERAACGGKAGPYPWGSDVDRPARWSTRIHPTQTMTVATAPVTEDPNPSISGIKHAAGNVWEWTADWYHRDAYSTAKTEDPQGPKSGTWKTLRGGSFSNLPSFATCTHREPAAPAQRRLTAGFRCAYPKP